MTVTATERRTVQISLELGCCHETWAHELFLQLNRDQYRWPMSVLELGDYDEWLAGARTIRRSSMRAERLGYEFRTFDRADHLDDLYAINTSRERRQGRPMSDGYRERPAFGDERYPCDRHRVTAYGVFTNRHLVAYTFVYRAGDLALVSTILGHAEHEPDGVMRLLMRGTVHAETPHGGFLVYNRHDSGDGDGLREFKEHVRFAPTRVEWLP